MMEVVLENDPYAHIEAQDDTEHVLWLCPPADSEYFQKEFEKISCTYIADGHHRAASAYNVGKMKRESAIERGEKLSGEESFMYFMAIFYPESNLKILDYNRVLKSLNGLNEEEFVSKVRESYDIQGPIEDG